MFRFVVLSFLCLHLIPPAGAQVRANELAYGGYNGVFVASGLGLKKTLARNAPLQAGSSWSMYCWIRTDEPFPVRSLLAGAGDTTNATGGQRYFAIVDGKLALWAGSDSEFASTAMDAGKWHFLAAAFDGITATLYADGTQAARKPMSMGAIAPVLQMAPEKMPWPDSAHFNGKIADFTFTPRVLTGNEIRMLYSEPPVFDLIEFEAGSKDWPVQQRQQTGYRAPQDPDTMPKSLAPASKPIPHPLAYTGPALAARGSDEWAVSGGWRLAAAPNVEGNGAQISQPKFQTDGWFDATVPGTVLTTLIDRGVYPDPYYGLNNLAIPETLNKQDYWYRTEFTPPPSVAGRRLNLTFHGINYAAVVWLNGKQLGTIKGAFIRGVFDVTGVLAPGKVNALAIRISPPPHPGIPQEQSIRGGPGENGGILCLDGPTFIDTEGWDWIPGIRDRNTGIWQDVTLKATDVVAIGDAHVITSLPLPDTSRADVTIAVPLHNQSSAAVQGVLHAGFEGVEIAKNVTIDPGETIVPLAPSEFPRLAVSHPRLWWPNGYGAPELYRLKLTFTTSNGVSDTKTLRFGIREISYELSLLSPGGHLRRVEYSPTEAAGQEVVDVRHEGIIQTAEGWVYSLRPDAKTSPGIRSATDLRAAPYLVVKVNGVRIACKGGNWGMDDALKRVSREHLEPYFRLHRDANLNIIRNWTGQSTEEVFYDLADEYGLLVWNDFWESTQNYNVEPSDTALFLRNARDTILRFRNHPSILLWCGRNEGVPSPAVNEGLDKLVRTLDGTRFYAPSSNVVNLQNSGPYKYQEPADYFTKFGRGFAVELGVPSMPTLDSFRSFVPEAEQWPPNDTWAYHDWHQSGNGDVAPFMAILAREFGPATDLEDFERKAQMLDYVEHRAIFEGFNAHLWSPNSGRMLWMTQPAWPSTMWQILSWDYDTQASFWGVKKACERLHVQLNLPDLTTAVVNNTTRALDNLSLRARVFSLDGKTVFAHEEKINAEPNATTASFQVVLPESVASGVTFVKLELLQANGAPVSENLYWYSRDDSTYRELNGLPKAILAGSAVETRTGDIVRITVQLSNQSETLALMNRLTVRNADGTRVLPAYYSDNYVSLLAGEKRDVEIECPMSTVKGNLQIEISGWNAQPSQYVRRSGKYAIYVTFFVVNHPE